MRMGPTELMFCIRSIEVEKGQFPVGALIDTRDLLLWMLSENTKVIRATATEACPPLVQKREALTRVLIMINDRIGKNKMIASAPQKFPSIIEPRHR